MKASLEIRRLKLALAGLGTVLALVGAAHAQAGADPDATSDDDREEMEGPVQLREQYFHMRREKPGDSSFDAARARLDAVRFFEGQIADQDHGRLPRFSTLAWSNVGPAPINNGQTPGSSPQYPSDVSGRVTAIAIDPIDNAVYVGGAQGGVWRSTNNGANWTAVGDTFQSLAIGSIAVDPASHAVGHGTIYVGTGEGNQSCDSYGGVGIYKSTDSGATWSGPLGTAQFGNRAVGWMAVDRTNSNRVLAASSRGIAGTSCVFAPGSQTSGIYLSTDGGATWSLRTSGGNQASVVIQDPFTSGTWWGALIYTGGGGTQDGGLVQSTDGGSTWVQQAGLAPGLPAASSSWGRAWITATVDDPTTPTQSVLYLGNSISNGTVYKSTGGTSWSAVGGASGYCAGQCFYDMPVYTEPGNPNVVYTGGAGNSTVGTPPFLFQRSDNGGASFADKIRSGDQTTALHADMHAITSWPGQPNRIWVGNDGGVWRSNDRGDNWVDVNEGLPFTQIEGCDLDPTGAKRLYAGSQDNGTEGWLGSSSWSHLDFGDGGFALIDQGSPNHLVHTYFNQTNNLIGVGFTTNGFSTTMGGYQGSFASTNGISLSDRVLFYAPIHLDHGVTSTLYFGTNHLWRAPNFFVTGGTGGEFTSVGSADLTGSTGRLSAIETFANPTPSANANIVYTGSNNGHVFRTVNATNASPTWTEVDVGGSSLFVSDIVVDPSNSNVVYASRAGFSGSSGKNVRKSTNGGASWNPAATGLPDIPVNALALDPLVANRVWAGTDIGMYVSTDGGANWTPYNTGMPAVAVFDLKAKASTKQLVACTHGRGAFLLSLDPSLIFSDDFESKNTAAWSSTAGGS